MRSTKLNKTGLNILGIPVLFFSLYASYAESKELARVNDTVITQEEFDQKYAELNSLLGPNTPSKKDCLNIMIQRIAVSDYGKAEKLHETPAFQSKEREVLYQLVMEKEIQPMLDKLTITDSETEDYYKKNPTIRVSQIFIPAPVSATPEQLKEAEKEIHRIYKENIQPKKTSFAEVAQKYSLSPEGVIGGDLGYKMRSQLEPTLYQAAVKLAPGKSSDILRSSAGFHIIQLTAIRPWSDIILSRSVTLVKSEILAMKSFEASKSIANRIEKAAKIKISAEAKL